MTTAREKKADLHYSIFNWTCSIYWPPRNFILIISPQRYIHSENLLHYNHENVLFTRWISKLFPYWHKLWGEMIEIFTSSSSIKSSRTASSALKFDILSNSIMAECQRGQFPPEIKLLVHCDICDRKWTHFWINIESRHRPSAYFLRSERPTWRFLSQIYSSHHVRTSDLGNRRNICRRASTFGTPKLPSEKWR